MRVYRYVMAFFAALVGLSLATGIASAAPLVMVSLQGSTDGGLTFSNSITASAGSVISYRVIAQIAAIGTTNGTKTIATRTDHPTASTANYDGINSLGFNLSTGSIGSFDTGALFTGTSSPGDDYTKVTGSSSGTLTGSSINSIFGGLQSGFYEGANVPAVLFTGNYRVSPSASSSGTIDIAYDGLGAGFGINANPTTGALTLANKVSVGATDTNGYLGFTSLAVAVPEPSSALICLVGSGFICLSRKRRQG